MRLMMFLCRNLARWSAVKVPAGQHPAPHTPRPAFGEKSSKNPQKMQDAGCTQKCKECDEGAEDEGMEQGEGKGNRGENGGR